MSDLTLTFEVPGAPVPKGRPRFRSGRVYTPRRTVEAEEQVGWAFRATYPGWQPDAEHRWAVYLTFHVGTAPRCDLDNAEKLVLDALNGLAYADDRQVWRKGAHFCPGHTRQFTAVELKALEAWKPKGEA